MNWEMRQVLGKNDYIIAMVQIWPQSLEEEGQLWERDESMKPIL